MKKTLIALAALGAMAGAYAQSSVALYGAADTWLGSTKETVGGVGVNQTVINTSGVNGSRFGLKGTEDLGGGLKAIFELESGFKLDTGEFRTAGALFDRHAFVGLQGGFGTVTMGRQESSFDDLHGDVNHNYDAVTFSATGAVADNGMADYTDRVSNSIKYTSPEYAGFSGSVLLGLGENKTASADATNIYSLHVKYEHGPLLVGYAYQQEKQAKDPVLLTQDKNKFNLIGASYDFGVAKLVGSYKTAKNATTKDKEYQFGVSVPFGAAAISAGYAHSKSDAGDVTHTGKGYSILGTYDLSKRTRLYAGAQNTKAFVLNAAAETKIVTYGLGIRHFF
ncbi:porin [Polaromonas jejuensis]|uniref:Porin n=1 Tax=Polaromonas jejuensis TaxID=457502 RepID=A0ABW0Q8C4_9BURK|nr:porin [Polaromonas jejuensis]